MRASDAEREQTADRLRHAAGEGRLTLEELDDRLQLAYAATTGTELERLTEDVTVHEPAPPVSAGESVQWIVAIMGGNERKGRWRVGRRCRVLNLMGGSDLDLNGAELAADRVEIRIVSIMGGSNVRVPDGLNVEVSETAIMGGNTVKLGDATPNPGGPVLHLRLFSLMGGTDVKRGRRAG